jgi:hypothetical protein
MFFLSGSFRHGEYVFFHKRGDCFPNWGEHSFKGRNLFRGQAIYCFMYALSYLLGVCFIAEDPKEREHLRQILSEAAPKLTPIKLRHSDRSQDEGVNRLKDEMT